MNLFNFVNNRKPNKNVFDLSHERKFSMNMGDLVPFLCEDIIPGDTWKVNSETFMRLAPLVAPVMHRVNVFTHFFFVPNRLIWDNFKKFITGGEDGEDETVAPYFMPNVSNWATYYKEGSLADYLGYPTDGGGYESLKVSSLPFRAYQLIYNEFYRDQNLEEPITIVKTDGSGGNSGTSLNPLMTIRKRAWEKDYFTSALPWTQKGGDVTLPLGDSAPVEYTGGTFGQVFRDVSTNNPASGDVTAAPTSGFLQVDGATSKVLDLADTHSVDLSSATSSTINELRRATKLQEWLEKNARGGSRYIEQILSHFGVRSSDARLQRPEYLGGGRAPVVISEVLQTSSTDTETPQGNMAGHGISVGNSNSFTKTFEEHGIIIGIMSVLPRTAYQQGLRRSLSKFDKFDYFWPSFAHLGEQPVYQKELYLNGENEEDRVFGYQSRYAEYKFIPSTVHGDMKSTLQYWHMGRYFESEPNLNSTFIQSDPTHDIFADTDVNHHKLYVQMFNKVKAIRPMPKFGTPQL